MPKMLAVLTFSRPAKPQISAETDAAGNPKYDLTTTTITRGSEFDADDDFAAECIERGYAVRSDSPDAEFLRSAPDLIS
ncbi:hypothetical protein ACD589_00510 [Rhizobium sp. 814_E9_N1_1]|uniref:hypothetical protein n=1 Tax=unclassified Rhizobium TaxID=2613769 RepID=UPI003F214715